VELMHGFMERLFRVEEIPHEGIYCVPSNSGFKIGWSKGGMTLPALI